MAHADGQSTGEDESLELGDEFAIESLVHALGAQLVEGDGRLSQGAIEALIDVHRSVRRTIFAVIGHLVHYGSPPESVGLELVRDQLTEALRAVSVPGPFGVLPGDVVALGRDDLIAHFGTGDRFVVRWVGRDRTLDPEVDPEVDYGMHVVPFDGVVEVAPGGLEPPTSRL